MVANLALFSVIIGVKGLGFAQLGLLFEDTNSRPQAAAVLAVFSALPSAELLILSGQY